MHAFDPQDPISALPKPRNHKKTRYPLHKSTKQAEFACFRASYDVTDIVWRPGNWP